MQEYRQIILQMAEMEDKNCDEVNQQEFDYFEISKECFQESWTLVSEPENQVKF